MKKFAAITASAVGLIAAVLATTAVPASATSYQHNSNWAGYSTAGNYTEAAGSFTVPSLTLVATEVPGCAQSVTEVFVGVANKAGVKVRAGIDLSGWDPAMRSCTNLNGSPRGLFFTWAWYSIGATVVQRTFPLTVQEGDVVGVTLQETTSTKWSVGISDQSSSLSKGLTSSILAVAFTGPATSASWIVGAPFLSAPCNGQCATAPYTAPWNDPGVPAANFPAPALTEAAVNFVDLSIDTKAPSNTKATKYTQYAGNTAVSMPSQPLADGFGALFVTPGMLGDHSACLGGAEPCFPFGQTVSS